MLMVRRLLCSILLTYWFHVDVVLILPWWRHQMETFSALLAICAGNSPVPGEFPTQRPVTQSFDVFFDLRLNKRLSKQSRRRWFETSSRLLWRHCNAKVHPKNYAYGAPFVRFYFVNLLVPSGCSSNFTMMTSPNGNIFRVTGHLCGEFTGPRWIPHTKASNAELWCFLWSASE